MLEDDTELEITGFGFPEHRPGQARFIGSVHAPGRAPRAVSVELPIKAESSGAIRTRVGDDFLERLSLGAAHATFRGDVVIDFEPIRPGAPGLAGRARDVVADVFVDRAESEGAQEQAQRFADFLGASFGEDLRVASMQDDSLAARIGLQVGDQLHELDGLRLHRKSDLVPQARADISLVELSRQGRSGRARVQIPRAGFQTVDIRVVEGALAALFGVVLAAVLVARPPRWTLWWATRRTARGGGRLGWDDPRMVSQLTALILAAGVIVFVWALLRGAVPLAGGHVPFDVPLALALGVVPILLAAFVIGGARSGASHSSFGLVAALVSTWSSGLCVAPVIAATAFAAARVGSLELQDFVRQQGPWPTDWFLLESPATLLLGAAFFLSLVPLSGRRPPAEGIAPARLRPVLARSLEWTGHTLLVAMWVVLFAGGTAGVDPARPLSGLLLAVKVFVVLLALTQTRARLGFIRRGEALWAFALPNALIGVGAAALGWTLSINTGPWSEALEGPWVRTSATAALVACAVLGFVAFHRSLSHRGRLTDPWI